MCGCTFLFHMWMYLSLFILSLSYYPTYICMYVVKILSSCNILIGTFVCFKIKMTLLIRSETHTKCSAKQLSIYVYLCVYVHYRCTHITRSHRDYICVSMYMHRQANFSYINLITHYIHAYSACLKPELGLPEFHIIF